MENMNTNMRFTVKDGGWLVIENAITNRSGVGYDLTIRRLQNGKPVQYSEDFLNSSDMAKLIVQIAKPILERLAEEEDARLKREEWEKVGFTVEEGSPQKTAILVSDVANDVFKFMQEENGNVETYRNTQEIFLNQEKTSLSVHDQLVDLKGKFGGEFFKVSITSPEKVATEIAFIKTSSPSVHTPASPIDSPLLRHPFIKEKIQERWESFVKDLDEDNLFKGVSFEEILDPGSFKKEKGEKIKKLFKGMEPDKGLFNPLIGFYFKLGENPLDLFNEKIQKSCGIEDDHGARDYLEKYFITPFQNRWVNHEFSK